MPIVSVPLTGNHLQTSKNLEGFLSIIAFPAGSSNAPEKVNAQVALHMAMDWLVNATQWQYFIRRAASGTFTAGTAAYTVPERIQAVSSLRITSGNPRPIYPLDEELYNRVVFDQSAQSLARYYSLDQRDQHSEIIFFPTPDAAETFQLDYYRDPEKPTDLSGRPDLATWMEAPVISYAQGLVALWKGRPDHVNFFRVAEQQLQQAMSRDHTNPDDERGFLDQQLHGTRRWPWDHPNYSEDYR